MTVHTGAERVLAVIEQMADLPRPDGDEWLDWEIDGLAGRSNSLLHMVVLGPTPTSVTEQFGVLADRRWGARRHAPASPAQALDWHEAVWWRFGNDAVVLADDTVFVLPAQRLAVPTLVEDFLSGDRERVLSATWTVFRTRDPALLDPLARVLPSLVEATAAAELGGMLASNNTHLEHTLRRIELFGQGACLCAAYPSHQFYDPKKEEDQQHIQIVTTVPNDRQWVPDRICECRDCGNRFQVEQGEYHYTWWAWTEVT